MKRILILLLLISLGASNVNSQVSIGGKPLSFEIEEFKNNPGFIWPNFLYYDFELKEPEKRIIAADINWEKIKEEDDFYNLHRMPVRVGISLDANINPGNSGTWDELPCGTLIWRLQIKSPGAKSLSLLLNDFFLPENSRLFIYDESKDYIIGAFNSKNNNDAGALSTHLIPGSSLIIEFEQFPRKNSIVQEPSQLFRFNVEKVLYNYVNGGPFETDKGLGDSGFCNVNINCPEGNNWQKQKRGIAKMIFTPNGENWYICTGSLINNTNRDAHPFFLTAEHCGGSASDNFRYYWMFYFNYERTGCGNTGNVPENMMISGAELKALGPFNGGSDFQLLKLTASVPTSWDPYYNGWNRGYSASPSGASIHHPSGDAKKISTYTSTLTSHTLSINGETMASNSTWRVIWASTQSGHGVTEGGSSGGPLFNSNKQIVGTLAGGAASCSSPGSPDYFGKFNFHWDQNGETNNSKLQPWLDPEETGVFSLGGFDPNNPDDDDDDNDIETILFESFEAGVIPSNWTQEVVTGNRHWIVGSGNGGSNPSSAYEGSNNAYFRVNSSSHLGYTVKLVTPELNIPPDRSAVLTFYHHNEAWDNDQDVLRIYYKNSPDSNWNMIGLNNSNNAPWSYNFYNLPNPTSAYYIAFEATASWGYGVCIDNIKVDLLTDVKEEVLDVTRINVFPNPAQNYLNIEVSHDIHTYEVVVMSIEGKIIKSKVLDNTGLQRLNIESLYPGVYLLRVSSNSFNKTIRIIKSN